MEVNILNSDDDEDLLWRLNIVKSSDVADFVLHNSRTNEDITIELGSQDLFDLARGFMTAYAILNGIDDKKILPSITVQQDSEVNNSGWVVK